MQKSVSQMVRDLQAIERRLRSLGKNPEEIPVKVTTENFHLYPTIRWISEGGKEFISIQGYHG